MRLSRALLVGALACAGNGCRCARASAGSPQPTGDASTRMDASRSRADAFPGAAEPAPAPFDFDEARQQETLAHAVFILCDDAVELGREELLLRIADYLLSREVDVAGRIPGSAGIYRRAGMTFRASAIWRANPPELEERRNIPPLAVPLESHGSSGYGLAFLCAARLAISTGEADRAASYLSAAIRHAVHLDAWAETSSVELMGEEHERRRYPEQIDYDSDRDGTLDPLGTPSEEVLGNAIADGYPFTAFFLAGLYAATGDPRWDEAARGILVDALSLLEPTVGGAGAIAIHFEGTPNPDLCRGTALVALLVSKMLGEVDLVFPAPVEVDFELAEREALVTRALPAIVAYFEQSAYRETFGEAEGCGWLQTDAGGLGGIAEYTASTWGGGSAGIAATLASVHENLADAASHDLARCAAEWVMAHAVPDAVLGGVRWLPVDAPCATCPDPRDPQAEELLTLEGLTVDGRSEEQGFTQASMCRGVAGVVGALAQVGERLEPREQGTRERLRQAVRGGVAWLRGAAEGVSSTDELGGYLLPRSNLDMPGGEDDRRSQNGGMQATPSAIQYLGMAERFFDAECLAGDQASCGARDEAHDLREGLFARLGTELDCQDAVDHMYDRTLRARARDCTPVPYPFEP
ncbi:MAG: hypothetical protein HYY06_05885 [Deltaproteobacteria bacterium]|nr:hypothetical protein [Deltaproteobacteria bacterium]